jgi:hypothetical protein
MQPPHTFTPQQVVAWFREKATELNQLADTIETTLAGITPPSPQVQAVVTKATTGKTLLADASEWASKPFTVENVKALVSQRNVRTKDVSDIFGVSFDTAFKLIRDNSTIFNVKDRGWLALGESVSNQPQDSGAS